MKTPSTYLPHRTWSHQLLDEGRETLELSSHARAVSDAAGPFTPCRSSPSPMFMLQELASSGKQKAALPRQSSVPTLDDELSEHSVSVCVCGPLLARGHRVFATT